MSSHVNTIQFPEQKGYLFSTKPQKRMKPKKKKLTLDGMKVFEITKCELPEEVLKLDISNSKFTELVPEDLKFFWNIHKVEADGNFLSLEEFWMFQNLREISLVGNKIRGVDIEKLFYQLSENYGFDRETLGIEGKRVGRSLGFGNKGVNGVEEMGGISEESSKEVEALLDSLSVDRGNRDIQRKNRDFSESQAVITRGNKNSKDLSNSRNRLSQQVNREYTLNFKKPSRPSNPTPTIYSTTSNSKSQKVKLSKITLNPNSNQTNPVQKCASIEHNIQTHKLNTLKPNSKIKKAETCFTFQKKSKSLKPSTNSKLKNTKSYRSRHQNSFSSQNQNSDPHMNFDSMSEYKGWRKSHLNQISLAGYSRNYLNQFSTIGMSQSQNRSEGKNSKQGSASKRHVGKSGGTLTGMAGLNHNKKLCSAANSRQNFGEESGVSYNQISNQASLALKTFDLNRGVFEKLQKLNLGFNAITDFKFLQFLPLLRELDLSGNGLKTLPVTLTQNQGLEVLNLSHNRLGSDSELTSKILQIANIKILILDSNKISKMEDQKNLTENYILKELSLESNKIGSIEDLNWTKKLRNLRLLEISKNPLKMDLEKKQLYVTYCKENRGLEVRMDAGIGFPSIGSCYMKTGTGNIKKWGHLKDFHNMPRLSRTFIKNKGVSGFSSRVSVMVDSVSKRSNGIMSKIESLNESKFFF